MKKLTTCIFIKRSIGIHGDKYCYDDSVYTTAKNKVKIHCNIHGVFYQAAYEHSIKGKGCPSCGGVSSNIQRSKKILQRKFNNIIQPLSYKIIPLTKGIIAKVDNDVFEEIKNINWITRTGKYAYNNNIGLMHRYILKPNDDDFVDHINHDRTDNRRSNLRICNNSENLRNMVSRVGSSKYKGVCWHKKANKWVAYIGFNNKLIHIGLFMREMDAARAYDEKAIELFGEFHNINFKKNEK